MHDKNRGQCHMLALPPQCNATVQSFSKKIAHRSQENECDKNAGHGHMLAVQSSCKKNSHVQRKLLPGRGLCISPSFPPSPPTPPSAANLGVAKLQQRKQHRKKHVRFHTNCKNWDGLRPQNARLQRLVVDFFAPISNVALLQQLLTERKEYELFMLCEMLTALIVRMKRKEPTERTLLLPKGSRKSIKLNAEYLPRLSKLLNICYAVHEKCKSTIARTNAQTLK